MGWNNTMSLLKKLLNNKNNNDKFENAMQQACEYNLIEFDI